MGGLGTTEIILIVAVVLLFFGASRIPALAEAVGKGVRSFKRGLRGDAIDVTPGGKKDELPPNARSDSHRSDEDQT